MSSKMRLKYIVSVFLLFCGAVSLSADSFPKKWSMTEEGLPYCKYIGDAPTYAEDPYFLLGNYRMTMFTHVSGAYQLISGERVWTRFNADPVRPDYGRNRSTLRVDKSVHQLIGPNSLTSDPSRYEVTSGVGYTRYDYSLDGGIKCTRMISVMPSEDINSGNPAFLINVTIRNTGKRARRISYDEALIPNFTPMNSQLSAKEDIPFKYPMYTEISFGFITTSFTPVAQKFFHSYTSEEPFFHEVSPQSVFLYSKNAFLSICDGEVKAMITDFKLRPGESRTFDIIIGIADEDVRGCIDDMVANSSKGQHGAFESKWKEVLPDFSTEKNKHVCQELYRRAHLIEASAVFDSYFNETFIPRGNETTYHSGENLDIGYYLRTVLAASYTNPRLARSILRYVMKQTDSYGRIAQGNIGYGYVVPMTYENGFAQLSLFEAVAKYLSATKDYDFLNETVSVSSHVHGNDMTVMQLLERCFVYYRDHIASSSDLSLAASVIFPDFADQLSLSEINADKFIDALRTYSAGLEDSMDVKNISVQFIPYYIESPLIPASSKRDLYDSISGINGDMLMYYHLAASLVTFDRIEASSLFTSLLLYNSETDDSYDTFTSSWSLYTYYKLLN